MPFLISCHCSPKTGCAVAATGRTRFRLSRTTALFLLAFATNNPLSMLGGVTLSPVAVVGSDLGEYNEETPFDNMINQSGIAAPFVSGATDFDTYFATPGEPFGDANYRNNWQSQIDFDLPLTGSVDFDLGAAYALSKIALWSLSLQDVRVELFDDLDGVGRSIGSFTVTNELYSPFSYRVQVFPLTPSAPARYVRLNIDSVYTYSVSDNFGYAIVGEVAFSAETPTSTPPHLQIARNPNGDITVAFGGILESAPVADGDFAPVDGSPQGTYTIPADETSGQVYFRARLE